MEKTNLENLNRLAKLFGTDRLISPEDIEAIRDSLIGVLANNKKEIESLTEETKQAVNSILDKVLNEHDTYLEKTKQIAQEAKSETTEAINSTLKSLEEVKALCKEVMECKPENGEDADEEYVIQEVLAKIKLPEYKEVVLDDGTEIVAKINELPVNEDNQIDAKHIKNLPEFKNGRWSGITKGAVIKLIEESGAAGVTLKVGGTENIEQGTLDLIAGSGITITDNGDGTVTFTAAGGSGSPGGSTTQLQYNNAGAFGGIAGATTDGTATTFTTGNLKAADVKASGSGGFLIQSNSGTDVGLFGAGGGSGATFYGGVNISGELTVDTNTLYVDATNNKVGIGTASPLTQTGNVLQVGSTAAVNQYLVFQTNNGAERGIQYYLLDGTTLRGYMKWDTEEDLLLKGDTLKISTQNVTNPFHFGDGGGIGLFGIGTTAPTHSLTLNSTSTGIALYNTADQTTNYERGEMVWSANEWLIRAFKGGTGTQRNIKLISHGILTISGSASSSGDFIFNGSTSSAGAVNIATNSTFSATSGVNTELKLAPTISQSSTAGYTALLVNPTETTTGSGSKLLADFQVGGSSKAKIDNTGVITTLATIELGNASDTTISRSSAGVLAVEGVVIPSISSTNTLTNKRMQPRTASSTTASTLTPDLSSANVYYRTTQTASLTINAPTGTPVIGETIAIYVDSAGAQTLTMDSTYKAFGAAFPATTTAGKTLMITAQYNGTDWKTLWANAV